MAFQPSCPVCERSVARGLCTDCAAFAPLQPPLCPRCGDPITQETENCGQCLRRGKTALEAVRSLFWLEDTGLSMVHRIKFCNEFEWLSSFVSAGVAHWPAVFPAGAVLIPVPLSLPGFLRRSFNQAEVLAGAIGKQKALQVSRYLVKTRTTSAQSRLSRPRRQKNLAGAFTWRAPTPAPETVILIDDIYTTGATFEACARTLRRSGTRQVFGWTLFRTPLRAF